MVVAVGRGKAALVLTITSIFEIRIKNLKKKCEP